MCHDVDLPTRFPALINRYKTAFTRNRAGLAVAKGDPGVRDEQVDRANVTLNLVDHRGHCRPVRHVEFARDASDFLRYGSRGVPLDVGDNDRHAVAVEAATQRPADAMTPARYDGNTHRRSLRPYHSMPRTIPG